MNSVQQPIIVSRAAVPNSAVAQGNSPSAQICGFADPAPLSPQEAQRLAMLLSPTPVAVSRARRPIRAEDQKGGRVDIRC